MNVRWGQGGTCRARSVVLNTRFCTDTIATRRLILAIISQSLARVVASFSIHKYTEFNILVNGIITAMDSD